MPNQYTKEEMVTMLTSFVQGNRKDYAEQVYELLRVHFNGQQAAVSGSLPKVENYTRFDLERAHIAGWNNEDFEDWFQFRMKGKSRSGNDR